MSAIKESGPFLLLLLSLSMYGPSVGSLIQDKINQGFVFPRPCQKTEFKVTPIKQGSW